MVSAVTRVGVGARLEIVVVTGLENQGLVLGLWASEKTGTWGWVGICRGEERQPEEQADTREP